MIYHVSQSDGQIVQMDINGLKDNIKNGTIIKDTLIWKQGLSNWVKASEMAEVNALFDIRTVPPEIQKNNKEV